MFNLIERQGTLEQVSNFLRERGLPHSAGSWRDMIGLRLRGAVKSGRLEESELLELLRQTEEHGSQHIFLFQLIEGRSIDSLFSPTFAQAAKAAGMPTVGEASIIDIPEDPTVVEVRQETEKGVDFVIFKTVEKRAVFEKISDKAGGGKLIVTYEEKPYRAVNVMKISDRGMAEIRIQSHADAISYGGLCESVFNLLSPIVDRLDWKDHKLDKFKSNLFDVSKRAKLMEVFGLRHTQHSNVEGNRLSASTGMPGASMYDDEEVVASVDRFLKKENHAHCERASITMKKNGALTRSVGLVASGEPNEFAITSKVSKVEYEHILRTVLENNK